MRTIELRLVQRTIVDFMTHVVYLYIHCGKELSSVPPYFLRTVSHLMPNGWQHKVHAPLLQEVRRSLTVRCGALWCGMAWSSLGARRSEAWCGVVVRGTAVAYLVATACELVLAAWILILGAVSTGRCEYGMVWV